MHESIPGVKGHVERAAHRLEHLNPSAPFVVRRNQMPGRQVRAGTRHHVLDCGFILRPLLAVAVIFGCKLVPLEGRLLAAGETRELRLGIDVQPKLEDRHTVLDELLFNAPLREEIRLLYGDWY